MCLRWVRPSSGSGGRSMYRKISAIVIPTMIAVGIIAYMLYRVWGDSASQPFSTSSRNASQSRSLSASSHGGSGDGGTTLSSKPRLPGKTPWFRPHVFLSARRQTSSSLHGSGILSGSLSSNTNTTTTYSEGVSSIVVERVFDIFTVALLGAVAFLFILNVPAWIYSAVIILPIVAGVIFFIFLFCIGKCTAENKYIRIMLTMLHEIRKASLSVRSHPCSRRLLHRYLALRYPRLRSQSS